MKVRPCAYTTVHHTNKTTQNECGEHKWYTTLKPYQCEYDRVRTLTVHHTNKRRTRQCKYDRVRTQRYTVQTRRHRMSVENINGTPCNHTKALSM